MKNLPEDLKPFKNAQELYSYLRVMDIQPPSDALSMRLICDAITFHVKHEEIKLLEGIKKDYEIHLNKAKEDSDFSAILAYGISINLIDSKINSLR